MARPNRCEIVADDEVAVLHVFSQCVRMAYPCGVDLLTGVCCEHRKLFNQDRLESLAGVYAIDVMAIAITSFSRGALRAPGLFCWTASRSRRLCLQERCIRISPRPLSANFIPGAVTLFCPAIRPERTATRKSVGLTTTGR